MNADAPTTDVIDTAADTAADIAGTSKELVEEESLVEEVSIDGMCGVY